MAEVIETKKDEGLEDIDNYVIKLTKTYDFEGEKIKK